MRIWFESHRGTIATNGLGRATPAEAVPLFPASGLTG